jgi:DNA-binding beta-propeller fold protein YncE
MGQFNGDGSVDFTARAASGRVNGRVFYPRLLTFDPVDHRLFVGDQYNSRVLVYQLDPQNKILSRTATVVLGQPDAYTANLWDISAKNMEIPHALAYDRVNKWLFVADGWHDRVLIFDADPKRMKTYEDAMFVLGQPDFKTIKPRAGATGVNFEIIGESRGIGGDGTAPVALAVDSQTRRLFVSDGGNNRVLVYDLNSGNLKNGAAAINVIGQPDFPLRQAHRRQPAWPPAKKPLAIAVVEFIRPKSVARAVVLAEKIASPMTTALILRLD